MTDDLVEFAPDAVSEIVAANGRAWKVLIADDDQEVHEITKLALGGYEYLGRSIEFLDSYDYATTIDLLRTTNDIAVILLDVVMDEVDSGLKVVNFVRNVIHEKKTRIILRTGEPGSAPEKSVITDYDINDYKEKTELTSIKLYTSVHTSIKNYNDLRAIHSSRDSLNNILSNSGEFYMVGPLNKFIQSAIGQFANLMRANPDVVLLKNYPEVDAVAFKVGDAHVVGAVVGTGKYSTFTDAHIHELLAPDAVQTVKTAFSLKQVVVENGVIACPFSSDTLGEYVLLFEGFGLLDGFDYSLVNVFLSHICRAMENSELQREIFETQSEIINVLGEVVETRSSETSAHVSRVSTITRLLAEQLDFDADVLADIQLAATLHDLGKIGISDAILNKPGKLTPLEFDEIKKHTIIGAEILRNSTRRVFKMAKKIAIDHHEKWDGTGYPTGKIQTEICLEARIVALADVYDALRSQRSYKEPWSHDDALEYVISQRAKHFDPLVVDKFLKIESSIKSMY